MTLQYYTLIYKVQYPEVTDTYDFASQFYNTFNTYKEAKQSIMRRRLNYSNYTIVHVTINFDKPSLPSQSNQQLITI